ncbi:hypothetical protein [Nocardia sp. AG03]|uniref:hypothetical protein n=1 Tax=Nocardia sp. AG03 TaxID=3025312 RepID=UPI00241831E0|nr:hypothetical protein [Nocardia sp. AG03]
MNVVRGIGIGAAIVVAATLSATGGAAADPVVVPFQVNPAPFGNPNGSFDVPPIRCAVVLDQPGSAVITGGNAGGWGCLLSAPVHWVNLTTGATGYAQLSDGLNGIAPRATIETGAGQIALMLTSISGGTTTPGFATFAVA